MTENTVAKNGEKMKICLLATMSLTWKVSAIQEPPAASKKRNYPLLVFLSCVCSYSPVDKVTCLAALTVRILS
jgi:hypothetical protein